MSWLGAQRSDRAVQNTFFLLSSSSLFLRAIRCHHLYTALTIVRACKKARSKLLKKDFLLRTQTTHTHSARTFAGAYFFYFRFDVLVCLCCCCLLGLLFGIAIRCCCPQVFSKSFFVVRDGIAWLLLLLLLVLFVYL